MSAKILQLTNPQAAVMRDIGLPTTISSGMTDDELSRIAERLLDEVQRKGFNDSFDGYNEYGEICTSIYDAMGDLE